MKSNLNASKFDFLKHFASNFINPSFMRTVLMKMPPENAKLSVKASPDFATAATRYDAPTNTHHIYMGADHKDINGLETDDSLHRYTMSCMLHEYGHIHYTDKDLKKLNKLCNEKGIPFQLLNLAEDARIEVLIKRKIRDTMGVAYKFGWEEWLETPEETADMSAEAILFSMINCENKKAFSVAAKANLVGGFYDRFINATNSEEVLCILEEWVEMFHPNNAKKNDKSCDNKGDGRKEQIEQALNDLMDQIMQQNNAQPGSAMEELCRRAVSDMMETAELQDDPAKAEEIEAESLDIKEASAPRASLPPGLLRQTGAKASPTIKEYSSLDTLFSLDNGKGPFFEEDLSSIIALFRKLAQEKKVVRETRTPSRLLNTRRMASIKSSPNSVKLYKDASTVREKQGQNILFVLDLSGSMSGKPIDAQRTILLAANSLAQGKVFNIDVIASKSEGYQAISLPCSSDLLLSIMADSGDGIAHALKKNINLLKSKDAIVFITDGQVDAEFNLEMMAKVIPNGCTTVGLYVGRGHAVNHKMADWFDHFISEESLVDAVKNTIDAISGPGTKKNNKLFNRNSGEDANQTGIIHR